MSAGVGDFKAVVLRELLAGLDLHCDPMPLGVQLAERAFVDGHARVDEIALVFRQPLSAVECAGGFLAAGEGDLDGAQRPVLFLFVADQGVHPNRGFRLVVDDAAGVEVAVLFKQLERIAGPVLALRLDHINVSEQHYRLELGIAAGIEGDQAAFLGMTGRRKQVQIGVRESCRLQAGGHAFRGHSAAAVRQRGVGFDEFLVELAKLRFAGRTLRRGGQSCGQQ